MEPCGIVEISADMVYHGQVDLELDVELLFNWVYIAESCVQAKLKVRVTDVEGRIRFYWSGYPSDKGWIGFQEPPSYNIDVQILVMTKNGSLDITSKVKNIAQEIIKYEIYEKLVYPAMDVISMPGIGKKHERRVVRLNYDYADYLKSDE